MIGPDPSPHDICTALRPCHLLLKYAGVSPVAVAGPPGNRRFRTLSPLNPFRWVLHVYSVAAALLVAWHGSLFQPMRQNLISELLSKYTLYVTAVLVLAQVCSLRLQERALWRTVRSMLRADEAMAAIGLRPDNRGVGAASAHWIALNLLSILSVYVYLNADNFLGIDLAIMNCVNLASLLYKTLLEATVRTWIYSLKIRFRILHGRLDRRLASVDEMARVYLDLCGVADGINRIYSLPLLVNIAIDFAMVTAQLYYYCSLVYGSQAVSFKFCLLRGVWMLYHSVNGLSVVLLSAWMSKHANFVKVKLLKAASHNSSRALRKQINAFSLQLLHVQVKISAADFFDFDLPLIFTMIATASTYLVILVQFDLAAVASSSRSS